MHVVRDPFEQRLEASVWAGDPRHRRRSSESGYRQAVRWQRIDQCECLEWVDAGEKVSTNLLWN
jgi:hypothetical protein